MFDLTDQEIALLQARIPDLINLIKVALAHTDQGRRVMKDLGPIFIKMLSKEGSLQ
jgi:hypothetical protein